MPTSLSELVDNMSGKFNSIECKSCAENNRCEECKKLIAELIKNFPSIYQFCNGNLNKFVLLLRKGVYPYKYMDSWEKFDEISLPPKKDFYSELNLEDIINKDYSHAQKVFEEFAHTSVIIMTYILKVIHYCLQIDVFENFRNKCLDQD